MQAAAWHHGSAGFNAFVGTRLAAGWSRVQESVVTLGAGLASILLVQAKHDSPAVPLKYLIKAEDLESETRI